MGMKDAATKDYMKDREIFADAFNQFMYGGVQVIDPERLKPLDGNIIGRPYGSDDTGVLIQRYRDILKYLTAMEDDTAIYLLLGIENQSEVHYAMPVKNMVYDALQYAKQVEQVAQMHREARKKGDLREIQKKRSSGEYLTGFYKEDRLISVITLVVNFGSDVWDGPMCLHEMFDIDDKEILKFVSDYKINLLSPADMTDEEIDCFRTNLREVMLFIKYAKDKKQLKNIVESDERFKKMERKAAMVLSSVIGAKIEEEIEQEEVNMCQALEEMMMDAKEEGKAEGKIEERNAMVLRLLDSGKVSLEFIANMAGITVEDIKAMDEKRKAVSNN